jgi:hypothetical protein
MIVADKHFFHIPVMGIGFTVDTPLKVAHYGINSTISIMEHELLEQLRKHYAGIWSFTYEPINTNDPDYRAKRITAYLNMLNYLVIKQVMQLKQLPITAPQVAKYFNLLPDNNIQKILFNNFKNYSPEEQTEIAEKLKQNWLIGAIEVNIMTKVDKPRFDEEGNPIFDEFSDALTALRGFAQSVLSSSVVFSAGFNPRVYGYCERFPEFYPNATGELTKQIVLKVSDYRSALIQGKFLAKKGIWVSEFRIESGLNCGGHAFATDGFLLGPILEEFKQKRNELYNTLYELCQTSLLAAGKNGFKQKPMLKVTAQGGVGTAQESDFLIRHYQLNSIGWGSPFLLVPEATNVDGNTLNSLLTAVPEDYFLSNASPLGVPFNNFRKSSSEQLRKSRIQSGKAGSPCLKKFLQFDNEFTKLPICTASTQYQYHKLKQIKTSNTTQEEQDLRIEMLQAKDCICEGLSAPALLVNNIKPAHDFGAVTICPGPNLAYFSGVFTLQQMVDHIYGRLNILNNVTRPNVFINELKLYVKYLQERHHEQALQLVIHKAAYLNKFKQNLLAGMAYYRDLANKMEHEFVSVFKGMQQELDKLEQEVLVISDALEQAATAV